MEFGFCMDFEEFKLYCLENGLEKNTVATYVIYLKKMSSSIDVHNEQQVRMYLADQRSTLSPAGFNKYPRVLRKYFQSIGKKPFDCMKKLKEKPKARILLTDEEVSRVINYRPPPDKYGMFFTLMFFCGCRSTEARTLTIREVDISLGVLYLHKTKTEARTITIVEPALSILKKYLSTLKTEMLFPLEHDPKMPITYASYMNNWKKRLKACNITKNVVPYSSRHSFISNTYANGGDIFALMDLVGHKDIRSTEKYMHRNLETMRKTASKLPLARKHQEPKLIADQLSELIDEYLKNDKRFDPIELLEAKKHLYKSIL